MKPLTITDGESWLRFVPDPDDPAFAGIESDAGLVTWTFVEIAQRTLEARLALGWTITKTPAA